MISKIITKYDSPVFVFGCSYRCGSTLLQRLITSNKEVFVWGENHGLTTHLRLIRENLKKWDKISLNQMSNLEKNGLNAWIANLNPTSACGIQNITRNFYKEYYEEKTYEQGYVRWGFKEVRHNYEDIVYLLDIFPKCRIIFLIRNLQDVLASNAVTDWYKKSGGAKGVADMWVKNTLSMLDCSDERLLTIHYEDLVNNEEKVMTQVFKHLITKSNQYDSDISKIKVRECVNKPCLSLTEESCIQNILKSKSYKKLHPYVRP